MPSKTEVECLVKLNDKINCFADIIGFLSEENVIDRNTVSLLVLSLKRELPYELHKVLKQSLAEEKLQLVDYHWELLPSEKICLSIITKQTRRDFTWENM